MKTVIKKPSCITLLFLGLILSFAFSGCQQKVQPAVNNIEQIQAYTDLCFYGQKLTKVEITYAPNVDLSSINPADYVLLDRGYANPDFDTIRIESVAVNGSVVNLKITEDTEALPDNAMDYIGDNASGARTKNPLGVYVSGPWYRSVDGTIYFGSEDSEKYKANTTREGYQARECLELKLHHADEPLEGAACLANEDGSYNAEGLWLATIDANYGEGGFKSFEEIGIEVPTTATDGDQFVKGWAYFPENFDSNRAEKYPLIISIQGYGISYWKLEDGTNNFGTAVSFDGSAFRWMGNDAIVLNIHDRSHTGGVEYKFYEDDYNVIQHFITQYNADPEKITLSGNSRGTVAVNTIASSYPGLINTLILNNGALGSGIAGKEMFTGGWTEKEWKEAAKSGISIWVFDGELDTNNKDVYKTAVSYYQAAGWPSEWIADNIRITGFPTNLYYYWGETDHSTTKMTYWYFFDQPYFGTDCKVENGELVYNSKLKTGDKYQLKGRLVDGTYNKEGFEYVVYSENLRDWVLSRD